MLYFVKKGKIDTKDVKLFWNGWVHKFYHLKALITLEQVNTTECRKRTGVVIFHCMQLGLVMSMRFIFGDD